MWLMRNKMLVALCFAVLAMTTTRTHGFRTTYMPSILRSNAPLFSSSTSKKEQRATVNGDDLPAVEFVDPKTNCNVVLLGCFHGTESSANDVETVVTSDTDVVVLELCTSRFADMRREMKTEDELSWFQSYVVMIGKTVRQKGIPTGMAAAVLAGFSGLQSAISGFNPGLEFSTALACAQSFESDVVLADQDVDETLRQVGSLPKISFEIARSSNRYSEWNTHHSTLKRALFGDTIEGLDLPQVQLGPALFRNAAAVQDLFRLTVPPTLLFYSIIQSFAMITHTDLYQTLQTTELMSPVETIFHWAVSGSILILQYLIVALPSVRVILTERDEILAQGIQAACERAGDGGRVVAVLGMLHVNGVAKRMLSTSETAAETQ